MTVLISVDEKQQPMIFENIQKQEALMYFCNQFWLACCDST